jgi:hypothetical protein
MKRYLGSLSVQPMMVQVHQNGEIVCNDGVLQSDSQTLKHVVRRDEPIVIHVEELIQHCVM